MWDLYRLVHSTEFSVSFMPALHFDTQLEECRGERTSVCWIAILCRMNTTAENASLVENGNICSSDARYIVVVDAVNCQAVILSFSTAAHRDTPIWFGNHQSPCFDSPKLATQIHVPESRSSQTDRVGLLA
jgi:hypothetical protein